MRIFFAALIVIVGANIGITILDSKMVSMMEQRTQLINNNL